jgi:sugar phosphate permease
MTENTLKSVPLDYSVISNPHKAIVFTPWLICGLGALYYCYEYLLRISPSVMTKELMSVYHLNATEIGVFSAYYYHAYVPMQIIVGLLMDKYGPRKLLTMACMFCAFGTFLFASNYSLTVATLGRFLVGFGSAFAFVGALKLATIWLPPNRFALVSGLILCLGMLGAMMSDILLRILVDQLSWQVTLYASAVVSLVLAATLWTFIRDTTSENVCLVTSSLDFPGLLRRLWGVLKNSQIWLSGCVGLLLYLSLSAFAELWGIQYLQQAQGLSKAQAAQANSLIFFGWAIGGPLWGWVSDFIKLRRLPMLILAIIAMILACVILYVPGLSLVQLYGLLFLFGLASSVQILVFVIARESACIQITATAIAITNAIVMMGGNVFQPMVGKFLDMSWNGAMIDGVRIYSQSAYQFALSIMPIGILLAVIIMFFIRETHAQLTENT